MKARSITAMVITLLLLVPAAGWTLEVGAILSVEDQSGGILVRIERPTNVRWNALVDGRPFTLDKVTDAGYRFSTPDGALLSALARDDKIKLRRGNDLVLKVRFAPLKIKASTTESGEDAWEFKFKSEKIKVERASRLLGNVRFHGDSGRLEAIDVSAKVKAVVSRASRLSALLAPFLLVDEMPVEQRMFLVLLLVATER
jgi:hypothetical protein